MYLLIAILFDLALGASVFLGIACVVRRVLIKRRTRRWIIALEESGVHRAAPSPRDLSLKKAPVEIWDHVVQFYGHDDELVDAVSGYLSAALGAHEVAIVVATEAHRRAFDLALVGRGVDLAASSYITLDASETMSKFVIDGRVDRDLFGLVVGQLIRTAAATGRPVRVYGEIVALLWDAGQINAAVELERLWNELGSVLPFSLYCAYPTHSVTGAAHRADLEAICHLHADMVGSESPLDPDHRNEREPIPAA